MSVKKRGEPRPPQKEEKRKPGERIPPDVWSIIRAMWEGGSYTFAELSTLHDISISTIKQRSSAEKWKEGRLSEAIQKKIEESTAAIFAKFRMPREKRIGYIVEAIRNPVVSEEVTELQRGPSGKVLRTRNGRLLTYKKTMDKLSYEVRLRYLQEAHKLCGDYAPLKLPVPAAPETPTERIPVYRDPAIPAPIPVPTPASIAAANNPTSESDGQGQGKAVPNA